MARTEKEPIQTFGRVAIHVKPGNKPRRILDTRYVVKVDGKKLDTISDFGSEQNARYFALGYAQGMTRQ